MADGWTECSGSFIVDEELQKMREPRLEIITVDETIPRATLEIDDVSIAFKSGVRQVSLIASTSYFIWTDPPFFLSIARRGPDSLRRYCAQVVAQR